MSIQQNDSVPCWLPNFMCIMAGICVLALIIATSLGADISIGTSAVVGAFTMYSCNYAYYRRT